VLGEKHPDTIDIMASLAATYHQQGQSGKAEEVLINVLQLRKEVLGEQPFRAWQV
jgi:thioredoxin-like negative regulator of GroEL